MTKGAIIRCPHCNKPLISLGEHSEPAIITKQELIELAESYNVSLRDLKLKK